MINTTQITVSSSSFKANTTEDVPLEDNPCVADKEVDEILNTYFTGCHAVMQVECVSICCLLPRCNVLYVNVI